MTVQAKLVAYVAALMAVVGAYIGWRDHERHVGEEQVLRASIDSLHRVDSIAQVAKHALELRAIAVADSLNRLNAANLAAAAKAKAHSDSAARAASEERDAATHLVESGSTDVSALRGEIERLVASGRADSLAHAQAAAASGVTIAGLLRTIAAKDSALERSTDAENAAVKRAVDAERATQLARDALPSKTVEWILRGGSFVVGVLAGRGSK